jgi:DNA-binding NtrC family response regulator
MNHLDHLAPLAGELPPIVLLIDSDRAALEAYASCFERAGLWVATTTAAEEAVSSAEDLRPDVIIADADGDTAQGSLDAIEILKHHRSLSAVPIVLLQPAGAGACASADVTLRKPVPAEFLLQRTRELVAHSRELRGHSNELLGRSHLLTDKSKRLVGASDAAARMAEGMSRTPCPECASLLEWVERGTIGGITYDYFRWCLKGCGLYCYNRDAGKWVKLA